MANWQTQPHAAPTKDPLKHPYAHLLDNFLFMRLIALVIALVYSAAKAEANSARATDHPANSDWVKRVDFQNLTRIMRDPVFFWLALSQNCWS